MSKVIKPSNKIAQWIKALLHESGMGVESYVKVIQLKVKGEKPTP